MVSHNINFSGAWIVGYQTKPITYLAEKNATTLSIQFKVGGLSCIFKIPSTEFTNLYIDAELVLGNKIKFLRENIMNLASLKILFQTVITFLKKELYTNGVNLKFLSFLNDHKKTVSINRVNFKQIWLFTKTLY